MRGALAVRRVAESPRADRTVPRVELDEWRERFGLVAGVTARGGEPGFSLGFRGDQPAGRVMERWRVFRRMMQPHFPAVVKGHQAHSALTVWHERLAPGWHVAYEADGHATGEPGVLLMVSVADCIPVYLAAQGGLGMALLHAGWRGIAAGILEAGVRLLCARLGILCSAIVVHLGVSICGECYEVGSEVVRAVEGRSVEGRTKLDLRAALVHRAKALGIGEITVSPLCTSCDRERFFSHRASGGRDGRMIAYLGRPLAPP